MRFCTQADLSAIIGLDKVADTYPPLVVLQDGIQASFESYMNCDLELKTRIVKVFFKGTMIPLKALPIRNITSVNLTAHAGVIQGLGYVQNLILNPNDYMVTPYGLKLVTYKSNGNAFVTVTYDGGLSVVGGIAAITDAMDEGIVKALEQAALQQIKYEWVRKENQGATTVSTDGGTTRFPELDLLKTVKRLLDPHKHPMGGFA